MKHLLIAFCLLVFTQSTTMSQSSWKSAEYKPLPYRKVMVLAKVSDVTARRQLEDFTAQLLNDKGIVAITAYSNIHRNGVISREEFLAIADSLTVDALLVYEVDGAEKHAEQSPTISVGVGVGMYGGYMGASAPIAGGAKVVTVVKVSAWFYNRDSKDEQWTQQLSGTLDGATDKLAFTFAKTTVKSMMKDGLFLKKK